jgi:tRNA (cmo5U34)-methyltransferase
VSDFHWDPDTYLAQMREEVPHYERLQEQAAAATGTGASRLLELGTGTGETARRVLARHPDATLLGLDASHEMLARARDTLPAERVELRAWRLTDPLPAGPFDLVFSALAVHHLDGAGKAALFGRVAAVPTDGGRLVLADLVVPDDPADVVTPVDGDYDTPSSVPDQLAWLRAAGLEPRVAWQHRDLAVLVAHRSRT